METFQKPLTQEEEAEYIRLLRHGSPEEAGQAQKILVERNLRLVVHIAKKYQNTDEDIEDFISIGCIGLIKAIKTFDDKKGRLATYACRCIENELLMFLRGKKKSSREVSLYEPIGQDKEGNEIHLVDVIEQNQPDVVESMELSGNIRRLFILMDASLTQRERQILIMRYGLYGNREVTQSEIGARLGISRSYPSVIIGIKLGKPLNGLRLYPYFYPLFIHPKLPKQPTTAWRRLLTTIGFRWWISVHQTSLSCTTAGPASLSPVGSWKLQSMSPLWNNRCTAMPICVSCRRAKKGSQTGILTAMVSCLAVA